MDASDSRITLDRQLVAFWLREAERLDALGLRARFGWQKRRLARKARDARNRAERSRTREAQRDAKGDTLGLSQG